MTLNELYTAKGSLVTQIEVAQAQLQSVNQQIVKQINENQSAANGTAPVKGPACTLPEPEGAIPQ